MAKPATAVDPQTTFTPAELSQSFQQYRTELIVMPMLAMQAALQHMTARTGIRYQQHVHEMKGNFEIGPYNKYKMGEGAVAIVQRTLETFFGNCIEPIDPNSIVQSLWGSDVTKGEALKNVPWVKRVCAYIMAQLGEKLFMEMWKAKRNAAGTTTHDLFNGFLAIEDIEIAADAMSQEEGNFYELPEAFDGDNTEELLKDWFFGSGSWKGIGPKLRSQKLKLFIRKDAGPPKKPFRTVCTEPSADLLFLYLRDPDRAILAGKARKYDVRHLITYRPADARPRIMEAARITTITMEIVFLFLSFIFSPRINCKPIAKCFSALFYCIPGK